MPLSGNDPTYPLVQISGATSLVMELKKDWLREAVKRAKSDKDKLPDWMKPENGSPTTHRFKHGRSSRVGNVVASSEGETIVAHKKTTGKAAASKAGRVQANPKSTKAQKSAPASDSIQTKGKKH